METLHANSCQITCAARWLARSCAAVLFVFWGAFFVEHTAEWFFTGNSWPPVRVTALHVLHFIFLVGLLVGWRWELAGSAIVFVAALLFFPQVSGKNTLLFVSVSVLPAIVWAALDLQRRRIPH